jgi:hypothetical protein
MATRSVCIVLALGLGAASSAAAHDFWIAPSNSRPVPGERVAIALRVGDRLVGEPVPRRPNRIVRFDALDAAGRAQPLAGVAGVDPAGHFAPAGPGLHWALYQGNRARLTLEPAKFAAYLAEEGLEPIAAERAARGESDRPAREAYSRSALAALCVAGEGAPPPALGPFGLALELVPESDPCAWRAGGEVALRLFFRGAPLAGARVEALHAGRLDDRPAGRTDGAGRVRWTLDRPGRWLVKAVWMERARELPEVEWESFWASLAFELPPG